MNYIKKIFKNDKDEYISFPSTDDNITCENGQKLRDVLDNFTTDDLNNTTYSKLNTTNKTVIGSINEVNDGVKKAQDNQVNLLEDDISIEGISDTAHDTLNTTNKTIIGAINEVNTQCKDIANEIKNVGQPTDEQINNAVNTYLQNNPISIDDMWSDLVEGEIYNVKLPPKQTGISAVFIQGSNTIYEDNTLDSLKSMLVVRKLFDDDSNEITTNYTLSGTLTIGTSTITVVSGDYRTTFNVIVSEKPQATLTSISAVYTQGSTVVYPSTSLDDLKTNLVVTATYSDNTTSNITNYTLSGTLTIGTSTITVTYQEKTTTFTVTVTKESGYVTNELKTYYDFTQYEDGYGTELNDLSGNNTPYTLHYNNQDKSQGKIGFKDGTLQSGRATVGAYNCDCAFFIDDHTTINYPVTIEAYIKAGIPKANISYMLDTQYKYDESATSKHNAYYHSGSNGIIVGTNTTNGLAMSGSASIIKPSVAKTDDNVWNTEVYNHVIITLNTAEHKVYLNGQLVINDTSNAPTLGKDSAQSLWINGRLKLLRLYNKVLTENEISRNYNDVIDTMGGAN